MLVLCWSLQGAVLAVPCGSRKGDGSTEVRST